MLAVQMCQSRRLAGYVTLKTAGSKIAPPPTKSGQNAYTLRKNAGHEYRKRLNIKYSLPVNV